MKHHCKEDFYSHFNMENIIDSDYTHWKTVCKDFERKNVRGYHDFYAHGLYLRNFKMYVLKIWTWSCSFSFSSGISMASSFKKTKVKLDLSTDIDMLLMVERVIRGGMCRSFYQNAKANSKCMKDQALKSDLPVHKSI